MLQNRSQWDVRNDRVAFGPLKYPTIVADLERYVNQLERALQKSTAKWKVVFGHHPIFTKGKGHDNEAKALKKDYRFEDVLVYGGADMYFAGHEVSGSSFKPTLLRWRVNLYVCNFYFAILQHVLQHHCSRGVHHFVSGATCRSHFFQGMDKNLKIDWFDNSYTAGFLNVHVTKNKFTLQFINALGPTAGSILKEVVIEKH